MRISLSVAIAISLVGCGALALTSCNATSRSSTTGAQAVQTIGTFERRDPAFTALVPADAQMEIIAQGFDWSEGPLWVKETATNGYLLFSDIPPNVVHSPAKPEP